MSDIPATDGHPERQPVKDLPVRPKAAAGDHCLLASMDMELLAGMLAQPLADRIMEELRDLVREEAPCARSRDRADDGPPSPAFEINGCRAALGMDACKDSSEPPLDRNMGRSRTLSTVINSDDRQIGLNQQASTLGEAWAKIFPFGGGAVDRVVGVVGALGKQAAPVKVDCVSRFVDSLVFSTIVYMTILLNVAFMVYAANEGVSDYDTGASDFVTYGEVMFLIIYSSELAFRLWRFGRYFWFDTNWLWNWLDAFLVVISFYYVVFESLFPNISFLRMQRIFKLAKILRVFRVVRMFKTLRGILNSIIATISTLFWSVIMLYVLLFMFALTFTLLTGSYFQEQGSSLDPAEKEQILEAFGSVSQSTLSLYMAITGGNDWSYYYNRVALTGPISSALLIVFMLFAQIALLNVILGFFVRTAMESMHATPEEASRDHAEVQRKLFKDFMIMIKRADTSSDGVIQRYEWLEAIKNGDIINYFDLVGLTKVDVLSLFDSLSRETSDGSVDLHTFTLGCMMMRGQASKFDVHNLQLELKGLRDLLLRCHAKEENAMSSNLEAPLKAEVLPGHDPVT